MHIIDEKTGQNMHIIDEKTGQNIKNKLKKRGNNLSIYMCYLLREQKLGQMIVELDTEGL